MPSRYRAAHGFWSTVWMLSIPTFIAIAVFWKWWVGLSLLFVATPIISSSVKRAAAQFVIEYAIEDAAFYERVLAAGVIRIDPVVSG